MLPDVRPLYPSLAHRVANPVCRHCHGPLTFGPSRKLCWRCYKNPAIKAQYPAQAKYRNKLDDGVKAPSLSPRPTLALPGTARKIAIMAARIARGWQPRHPGDAKPDED